MKIFGLLLLLIVAAYGKHQRMSQGELIREIVEELRDEERKPNDDYEFRGDDNEEDNLKELLGEEDANPAIVSSNPNLKMCHGAGLDCNHCGDCFPGGWCIKPAPTNKKSKCLCNYGWTGPHAEWVPNTNDPGWGINRIRAQNCLTPCHYTHHVRNKTCLTIGGGHHGPIPCHDKCKPPHGTCQPDGTCKCCRGWTGPHQKFKHHDSRYYADHCTKKCEYLGWGIPNPTCKPADDVPLCNPKCPKTDGKCTTDGRCKCCEGWTGPDAKLKNGHIEADFCDVYCPHAGTSKGFLCTIADYVNRRRVAGNGIHLI